MTQSTLPAAFRKALRVLRALAIVLIYVAAVWALYYTFRDFSWAQFKADVQERSVFGWRLALAVALVVLNYVCLFGYDLLAIRYIGRPLSVKKLWLASFIGHVSSFNFGAILGGSSMRYRFYSAWGFTTLEVLQLIAVLGVTFWMGVMLLAGVVFIVAPLEVPPNVLAGIPDWLRPIVSPFLDHLPLFGVALLAVVVGYLVLCWVRRQPLRVFGSEIPLPPPRMTIGQLAVSCADLMIASTILWVLLKSPGDVHYVQCLGIFLLAMVLSVITHVPGGIGILEATVVFFLPGEHSAVLLYRGVYYLLPLAVAGVLLLAFEIVMGREFLKKLAAEAALAEQSAAGLSERDGRAVTDCRAQDAVHRDEMGKSNGEAKKSEPGTTLSPPR